MRLPGVRMSVAGGLVLAAGGMVLQIVAGSELFPGVPPGPIVLMAGAVVVAVGPKAVAPYVATIVPAFVIVGGLIASIVNGAFVEQLTGIGDPGVFLGSWLQVIGLVVAFFAGVRMWRRSGSEHDLSDQRS